MNTGEKGGGEAVVHSRVATPNRALARLYLCLCLCIYIYIYVHTCLFRLYIYICIFIFILIPGTKKQGVSDASTHLRDVLDLLTAAQQERGWLGGHHPASNSGSGGMPSGSHHHSHNHGHHHSHHHGYQGPGGGAQAGRGGGAGVGSAVGIGEARQQTPMLITEGNALSLLNRLSWDTLRCVRFFLWVGGG